MRYIFRGNLLYSYFTAYPGKGENGYIFPRGEKWLWGGNGSITPFVHKTTWSSSWWTNTVSGKEKYVERLNPGMVFAMAI